MPLFWDEAILWEEESGVIVWEEGLDDCCCLDCFDSFSIGSYIDCLGCCCRPVASIDLRLGDVVNDVCPDCEERLNKVHTVPRDTVSPEPPTGCDGFLLLDPAISCSSGSDFDDRSVEFEWLLFCGVDDQNRRFTTLEASVHYGKGTAFWEKTIILPGSGPLFGDPIDCNRVWRGQFLDFITGGSDPSCDFDYATLQVVRINYDPDTL